MKEVLKSLSKYKYYIILSIAFTFTQTMLNLNLPNIMSKMVNDGIVLKKIDNVYSNGLQMLIYTVIAMLCAITATYLATRISAGYSKDLRNSLFRKVESLSLHEMKKISTSSLITRTTNDITGIQQLVITVLRMMVMAPLMCIGGIYMSISMNLRLSVIFAVVIPLLIIVIVILAIKVVPLFGKLQKLTDKLNQVVIEKLTGVRVIRAFGKEEYEKKRYDSSNKEIYSVSLKASYLMSYLMPIIYFIINISSVAIIWFGAKLINIDALEIGQMMAFIQYAMQVLFSVLMLAMMFIMIPKGIVSMKRVNEVLVMQSSIVDGSFEKEESFKEENSQNEYKLAFENVGFKYADGTEPVISGVNLNIKKGETIAIMGGTGSGKTSFLNLLLRFYDPTEGTIKLDGINISDFKLDYLREKIAYIPQKAVLFSGTITENITSSKTNELDEKVINAAKISQSYDFIDSLENKFMSEVSQAGTNFSGGQRQRLSIARAIYKDADIYVFDDSFSALDYTTDKKLREELKEKLTDKTFIIVAQRISTIMDADKILFIDEGKIKAMGTHKELFETSPEYKEIVLSQITEEEAI